MTVDHKLSRAHRFCLGTGNPESDYALLMAHGVSLDKEYVHIDYHCCQETVKFLLDNPHLEHLLISMTDGQLRPLIDVTLSDLELVSDGMDGLELSHCSTDLITLTAVFSYNSRVTTTPATSRH